MIYMILLAILASALALIRGWGLVWLDRYRIVQMQRTWADGELISKEYFVEQQWWNFGFRGWERIETVTPTMGGEVSLPKYFDSAADAEKFIASLRREEEVESQVVAESLERKRK